ncbi:hypothetical protein [Polynucleobacter alcilacus]|uniref:hypothetical protein n=1 Tax=Polynucleobacter alcilacus TaxID=1819739 RepID=UPI001C0D98FA|nr:hypothetical protein [Polynucleobacter alcilacus]MBU3568171.1 hypothetical protein [Polynucleobacter alcilacus]
MSDLSPKNYNFARDTAMKMADIYLQNSGKYMVNESWGPEGTLYLSESAYALLSIYKLTREQKLLSAVEVILGEIKSLQMDSGGLGIHLGRYGDGLRFKVTNDVAFATSTIEDVPPTIATLKVVADYECITGSNRFLDVGEKAYKYLIRKWSDKDGCFVEETNPVLQSLRSNPRSYQLFSYLGMKAWKDKCVNDSDAIVDRLLSYIVDTFESYDGSTMPLVYGLHAAILCQAMPLSYLKEFIKPRIDEHLGLSSKFRIANIKGAYGHRDGQRGIVLDEAHIRSACGAAIAMRFYDIYTNSCEYQNSEQYQDIAGWIMSMYDKQNGFYEFQDIGSMRRCGRGSPGQYLPIWWMTGMI